MSKPGGVGAPAVGVETRSEPGQTVVAASATNLVQVHGEGAAAVRALDGVDVAFEHGRLTAVFGPSGSGKSTLLRALSGLETVTEGTVRVGDLDVGRLDEEARSVLRRERVALVLSRHNLVPTLTVAENITLPSLLAGRAVDHERMALLVDALGLRGHVDEFPLDLSGRLQMLVALARAILVAPDLLCADEPTAALGRDDGRAIVSLLRKAVDAFGQTVVLATDDPFAAARADRSIFLRDGRVVATRGPSTADEIMLQVRDLHDA